MSLTGETYVAVVEDGVVIRNQIWSSMLPKSDEASCQGLRFL